MRVFYLTFGPWIYSGGYFFESTLKIKNIAIDLYQLLKEAPGITISVTLEDLQRFHQYVIEDTCRRIEKTITDVETETYVTCQEVTKILGVSAATLYR